MPSVECDYVKGFEVDMNKIAQEFSVTPFSPKSRGYLHQTVKYINKYYFDPEHQKKFCTGYRIGADKTQPPGIIIALRESDDPEALKDEEEKFDPVFKAASSVLHGPAVFEVYSN
jgi:hypothetical protein